MQSTKISPQQSHQSLRKLVVATSETIRTNMGRQYSRFARNVYSKPPLARLCLCSLLLVAFVVGVLAHLIWSHSVLLLARSGDIIPNRYAHNIADTSMRQLEPPRALSLISSAYTSGYPPSRIEELRRVIRRNLQLSGLSHYQLLCENDVQIPSLVSNLTSAALQIATFSQPVGQPVTYRSLFERANAHQPGTVAVIANADIFFDESILCATLLDEKIALALSRHPSPDCALASGYGDTGWEPLDFCAGYDPVRAASHDVFAFVTPLPPAFLSALGDLRVNQFGAENVVVYLLKQAGYRVINPCANIHAFHQHCDARTRASSARHSAGSVASKRKQFAGADKWGYQNVAEWAAADFIGKTNGLDCLAYGLANRRLKLL